MTDHHDALDRYLDDLAGNRTPRDELDPGLVATIDQIAEIGATPVPDRTFVDQLEERLMNANSTAPALRRPTFPGIAMAEPVPRPTRLIVPIAGPRRWAPILVSAALLLLTIGIAFGPLRPGNGDPGRGPAIPAAMVQASPSPDAAGVENELIASAAVETMPDTALAMVTFTGISRITLELGESRAFGPDSEYGDGVYLFEVETGALSLESTGPTELMTGGSDQGTPMPEGAKATLEAGDRGVLWPGTATTWRNDGHEPTVVLIAAAGEATFIKNDQINLAWSRSIGWPEPPATFAFRRLTFEPGASLPVAEVPGLMMLAVESGEIDAPLSNRDRTFGPLEGFVVSDWHLALDGNLRNSGSEPAVIYVLLGESTAPAATPDA